LGLEDDQAQRSPGACGIRGRRHRFDRRPEPCVLRAQDSQLGFGLADHFLEPVEIRFELGHGHLRAHYRIVTDGKEPRSRLACIQRSAKADPGEPMSRQPCRRTSAWMVDVRSSATLSIAPLISSVVSARSRGAKRKRNIYETRPSGTDFPSNRSIRT